ncbi:MAG: hypothetical protein WC451_06260 [Patescibacteria group bacterium]
MLGIVVKRQDESGLAVIECLDGRRVEAHQLNYDSGTVVEVGLALDQDTTEIVEAVKDVELFTDVGRLVVGQRLKLMRCQRGFLDDEGVGVNDSTALKLYCKAVAAPPR